MLQGLSSSQASQLLKENGQNVLPQKKVSLWQKLLKSFISPIALMLFLASGLSFALGKTFDGNFILVLLVLNIGITLWQESKADNAIKKLNENLDQKVKVLRDGVYTSIPSRFLVVGDIVRLGGGDVVPADGIIIEANHISINESALTGESLPKDKKEKDMVLSGSFLVQGVATIEISATGGGTRFGKTIFSVEKVRKKSLLERDIISISRFLTLLSLTAVAILSIFFLLKKASFLELLTLDLSLIIAGIPISLPTVMTLIIEFGVLSLAAKNVIVRRLSALEDLANVNFLLTDKTGTLTQNKITIRGIYAYDGFTHNDVISYAAITAALESDNPIDKAILQKAQELKLSIPKFEKMDFIPADSKRKRSSLIGKMLSKETVISVGAPQVVAGFCNLSGKMKEKFDREVEALAKGGYRTLAVAKGDGKKEDKLQIVGLLALSDTLRPDAKSVVEFLQANGVGVAMVTGDNKAIAAQIAGELSLNSGKVITKSDLEKLGLDSVNKDLFVSTGAFAEILPEDKFHLVQKAKENFIVASNGDGVNDLPALKAANVGIAVANAVTALKSTADIVLLSEGISVIKDALLESRKIFERLYTYSLYRISESLRLIVTIAILGLIYGVYPLTALQIILLALLNDIPIISLASDKVKVGASPSRIDAKKRFTLSSLYGLTGIANSLILFFIVKNIFNFPWEVIQTMYFLKLTVSGHMLIYVAHTKQRWWKFFPSREVIWATTLTQFVATTLALTGFLMPTKIPLNAVIYVWVWSLFWMQIAELTKYIQEKRGEV